MGSNKKRKKPFYLSLWLWIPVGLLVVGAGIGAFWLLAILQPYMQKAATFDLDKVGELPSASIIYDRKGRVIGQIYMQNRYVVPLEELPDHLQEAVMAQEDARFRSHAGVDFVGTTRAAWHNWVAGGVTQGGSTITQQLSRNTFGLFERTYERKLIEMFLAMRVEQEFSKDEILEHYLNLIYLGRGYYGVEAASRGYFGKHASELNVSESAALAGMIASPENREPWGDWESFNANRERVLNRMRELGFLSGKELREAVKNVPQVIERVPIRSQSYVLDYVRQQVIREVGSSEAATSEGFHVYTTIDLDIQKAAMEALDKQLSAIEERPGYEHETPAQYAKYREEALASAKTVFIPEDDDDQFNPHEHVRPPDYLQGAAVVLHNETGGILALAGGRNFSHSEYNRAVQARRPAGTAFTPFVYAAAFQKGIFPGTLFEDNVIDNREVMIGGESGILGEWGAESVENEYEGKIPARFALVKGKNAATVRVGFETGLDTVREVARRAGINSPLSDFPKTFLGESDVTPLELTLAYSNFANNGWHAYKAQIIDHILDNEGNEVYRTTVNRQKALDAPISYQVHSCLKDVLEEGTAKAAREQLGLADFPGGGKTGTAYNFTDLWFLGYSSDVTAGVWAGFDKPRPVYSGAFSKQVVMPAWVDIMNAAVQVHPPTEISEPGGLERVETCMMSGELATPQCYETRLLENGRRQQWRSTYIEFTTQEQKPGKQCSYHTGRGLTLHEVLNRRSGEAGDAPRPEPVIREKLPPVAMKSMTIVNLDVDPYSSVQPNKKAADRKSDYEKTSIELPRKKILKAQPVGPLEREMQRRGNDWRLDRPGRLDLDNIE